MLQPQLATNNETSDEAFLIECVRSFNVFFAAQDVAFIKNRNFIYECSTQKYLQLITELDLPQGIAGKSDRDLIFYKDSKNTNLLLEKMHRYDLLTMDEGKSSAHLVVIPLIKPTPFINRLQPLINPATGTTVGMLAILTPLYLINLPLFIIKNSQKYKKPDYAPSDIVKLTNMQNLILFLLCNFLSVSELLIVLDALGRPISTSRANALIGQLKRLFKVTTKEALVEKALRQKYFTKVPAILFSGLFYELDEYLIDVI